MGSPDRVQTSVKRDIDNTSDGNFDGTRGERDSGSNERKKYRSSKSRRLEGGEEVEGSNSKRSSGGEKSESRKRPSGSNRTGSDEDDYELRKESRSRQTKKKLEESALDTLSNWYQDGEAVHRHDGGDKSGSKGYGRADENERRKSTSKLSDRESSQSRSKGKDEISHGGEIVGSQEKDSRYSERKEKIQEKVHGSSDQGRSQRKRLDEADAKRVEEIDSVAKSVVRAEKPPTGKHESTRERNVSTTVELSDDVDVDVIDDKGVKSHEKEEMGVDYEKNKHIAEVHEEDRNEIPLKIEDIVSKDRVEEHSSQRNSTSKDRVEENSSQRHLTGRDNMEIRERPSNVDEESNTWSRERGRREIDRSTRSRTPEIRGRSHHDPEYLDRNSDRNINFRRNDMSNDGYKDDNLTGRDDSWSGKNRDRDDLKDNWRRRHPDSNEREMKDADTMYDHGRDWDLQRRRDRRDSERPLGRFGGRKDGNRTEAVKTSSNYGISNDNYDVIEIQTKSFDYRRDDGRSSIAIKAEDSLQSEVKSSPNDEVYAYPRDSGQRNVDPSVSGQSAGSSRDKHLDDVPAMRDQTSWRGDNDFQGMKGRVQQVGMSNRAVGGPASSNDSQPPYGNPESGSSGRGASPSVGVNRMGRGGRGRPGGRDNQHVGIPMTMMGPPFAPLGMPPPGALQPLTPSMSPVAGPPISPNLFVPPFPPVVWPGPRGVEMNMLAVPPGLSPVPPGAAGPIFPPNLATPPSPAMFFNQPGPGRGPPLNLPGPNYTVMGPVPSGQPQEKEAGGWLPQRTNAPPGKAPSRGEQNDYSQNFVDTGSRPQNFIRELELTSVVEDYPRLRELIQKKDEIVVKAATAPMYYKCDLREHVLSPDFFGTKFDVILVDPPWEEYVHRAPGVTDHVEYWKFEDIMNLKIEAIADTPSFIFLWVGDGVGLEQGRQCLKKWGFRRCEDICWVKTNKTNATPGSRHDSHTLFQRSKEHCLMGIKGTVRRSTDGHIIHANIDTDVIIAEEPPYGSTAKPEDMYRIIEHFALGRRRIELFGEDHNIRPGWLTVGKGLSSSNFNAEAFVKNFADKDGKVWQGGTGRNPPPEAGHLILTTPDIEALRPKSPLKNQYQLQQQSDSIALTSNSSNKRPAGNQPTNHTGPPMIQEASGSNVMGPLVPWGPPMEGYRGEMSGPGEVFHMYGYNGPPPFVPPGGEFLDFEAHRAMNFQ